MNRRQLVCIFSIIGFPSLLLGQYVPNPHATSINNAPIQKLVEDVSSFGWLYFREDLTVSDSTFFDVYGEFLGLGQDNEMRLERRHVDQRGRTTTYFRQHYQGIPIDGGEYSLHSENGNLILGHGKIIENLAPPTIVEQEELYALRRALDIIEAETYAWEDPSWEETIQAEVADSTARYFPKGELRFILLSGDQLIESNYRLAWYFEIKTLTPDDLLAVYVDAKTADIIKMSSLRRHCNSHSGTAQTLYNSYQSLDMDYRGWPHKDYTLKDCRNIQTKFHERNSFGETRGWKWVDQITHSDNDWDQNHAAATSAHWAAQRAWDYYDQTFGLTGVDGQEKATRIWVDWSDANGTPIADAMFEPSSNSNYLHIGSQQGKSLATLDIVGHEYTHGVVAAHANLVYERESGALDESFADIFGVLIERFGQGDEQPIDWLIGEDVETLRSLADPTLFGQPRIYQTDPLWFDATTDGCATPTPDPIPVGNDFCGVHTNAGVQNYWFYLLVHGGLIGGQQVYGIGVEKAAQIVFQNLTHYMQSHSNYQDARLGSIQSAIDLYGDCSNELAQVKNAWAAVGIGEANDQLCLSIQGPEQICEDQLHRWYTYTVKGVEGVQVEWPNLPDDWISDVSGYDDASITLRRIFNPGSLFVLEAVGSTAQNTETARLAIEFVPCSPGDTVPDAGKQPGQDSILNWSLIPSATWERMFVSLPEGNFPADIYLYDLQGRRLQSLYVQERSFALELQGIADGIYFLQANGPRGPAHKVFRIIR